MQIEQQDQAQAAESGRDETFGEFLSRIEGGVEDEVAASPTEEVDEVEKGDDVPEQEAEAEAVQEMDAPQDEDVPIEDEEPAQEASPIDSLKEQIKALDLPAETVARELGLAVSSKEITQLAQEMSKAKELQREAKKGAELVAQAREIISRAKQEPVELLREIAGPNFIDNYLLQQAGIEAEPVEEEKPDFNEMLSQREEQRRQQEIGAVVTPWRQNLASFADVGAAPNAVRLLGGKQELIAEAESLVDHLAIQREQELGRPLTPIEAHLLLQDWTPQKAVDTLEAEARRRLGVSEPSGEQAVAPAPQKPKKKPRTLTSAMAESAKEASIDLDKFESERDRLNAFLKSKQLKT